MKAIIVQGAKHLPDLHVAPVSDAEATIFEVLRHHRDDRIELSATWLAPNKSAAMRYAGDMAAWFGCDVEDKTHA